MTSNIQRPLANPRVRQMDSQIGGLWIQNKVSHSFFFFLPLPCPIFQQISVGEEHYAFAALPFSLAMAAQVFTEMVPVLATLRLRGIPFMGCLDDLLLCAVLHSKGVQVDFKFQDVLADSLTSPGISRASFGYQPG